MHPIALKRNSIEYPLNEIFGTEANIRILRTLTVEVGGSLTIPDIAVRSGISIVGVRKAICKLLVTGIIEKQGGGRNFLYCIRKLEPLCSEVITLFQKEQGRYHSLIKEVAQKILQLPNPPLSAWINYDEIESENTISLEFLHTIREISSCHRQLQKDIIEIESKYFISIEVQGYTKTELEHRPLSSYRLIHGIPPKIIKPSEMHSQPGTHEQLDSNSLLLARNLSRYLEKDQSLIFRAKNHLKKLLEENVGNAREDLLQWEMILDSYPLVRLSIFLTEVSDRATRLRQSNPFFAILTDEEKNIITGNKGL